MTFEDATKGNKMEKFDIAVLGSGPGGYVAAIRAAQLGKRVCVVEKDELGGTCLNRGCIPTKALLESSHTYAVAKNAAAYGVSVENVACDFARMAERKNTIVARLTKGIEALFKKHKITVVKGEGRIAGAGTLEVAADGGTETVGYDRLIIATGSEPAKFSFIPFDGERVLTSDEALGLTALPESIIIVGGGVIGCEFATMFLELGVGVTVVEMLPQLLPSFDGDVAKEMFRALKKKKAKVYTGNKIKSMAVGQGAVVAKLEKGEELRAPMALVATGRSLNSEKIGLDAVGVTVEKGSIVVDGFCRTSAEGVYAVGDVTGGILLAHRASRQGIVAAEHASGGAPAGMDDAVVPSAVYTHPEVGAAGLTEEEANERGLDCTVARFPFMALGRAQASGRTAGFVKIIADAGTKKILGVHIVGERATDLVAEAVVAMNLGATAEDIANAVHAHPTFSEAVMAAAEGVLGRSIHG